MAKVLKLKNAGSGGPEYSRISVDAGEAANYDINGRFHAKLAPSLKIVAGGGQSVILNADQVRILRNEMTAWLRKNAPVSSTSKISMTEGSLTE